MNGGRRTRAAAASEVAVEEKRPVVVKEGSAEEPMVVLDESHLESEVAKLRGRWELASVLNFLRVFEPVIGSGLKLSAEEIEMGLIKPNSSLAQLHIALLKGIPPVSKKLNGSDAWVAELCKKLDTWWPWVAEGETPLVAAKGEEIIPRYKQLDSTNRLLILKALCELRAHQDDTVSYINDALKQGNEVSSFRKDKIGGDGNGTSYWYDGNKTIGYRLYRELNIYPSKRNSKGKGCLTPSAINFQWETLATNLEEFRKVVDELSGSNVVAEVDVCKTIETDAIPILEKLQKNKERALKQKQRKALLLSNFANPYGAGITRTCRTRRPISYTFDEYDRAIDEAIQLTKKGKTTAERKASRHESNGIDSNGGQEKDRDSKDSSGTKSDSMDNDAESDRLQEFNSDNENEDADYCGNEDADYRGKDDDINDGSDLGNYESDENAVVKTKSLGAKNRLRQRPTHNSALNSVVVPDSEDSDDENVPENTNKEISRDESSSPGTTAEEASDS
ncbi:hypothetical protein RGQ29_008451 [Quercus rubra]|uniref:DDT domain-containing protein DDR4 n=1 Tax=Quercus rubra TaxID=3512 RepID=A0AAN7E1D0_QUERU|nr:hypothetical protein RGQ29_008451 [Quercus rubra]